MKQTSDNFFLDSNVALYLVSDNLVKKNIAIDLLKNKPVISSQVLNENINILFKKYKQLSIVETLAHTQFLIHNCIVTDTNFHTTLSALFIKEKYRLQWYDSLIIATALQANCTTLYTEDMHHNLVIEDTLTIVNPFVN